MKIPTKHLSGIPSLIRRGFTDSGLDPVDIGPSRDTLIVGGVNVICPQKLR